MRIAVATGTRADWGLLQPLASELRNRNAEVAILATHQHLIPGMGNTIQETIDDGFIPAAYFKAVGSAPEIMAQAAAGAAKAIRQIQPDAIVILGDRCEMLGVASASLLSGVPIIHIAGGTVSEGAFDDSVRHAITKMATLHFPETQLCAERIIRMGENPANVIVSGALGVENALSVPRMSRTQLADSLDGWDPSEKLLVVTLHAATLESGRSPIEVQEDMIRALSELPEDYHIIATYPNSDIDPQPLIDSLRAWERRMPQRVKVVPSLGKRRYLSAVALSCGVVGNSSSALVEVPSLGVGSLDIGDRQKGREHGASVIHSEADYDSIKTGLHTLLSPAHRNLAASAPNPYYKEATAELMADKILSFPFHPFPQKKFYR